MPKTVLRVGQRLTALEMRVGLAEDTEILAELRLLRDTWIEQGWECPQSDRDFLLAVLRRSRETAEERLDLSILTDDELLELNRMMEKVREAEESKAQGRRS